MNFEAHCHASFHHFVLMYYFQILIAIVKYFLLKIYMLKKIWLSIQPEAILRVRKEDSDLFNNWFQNACLHKINIRTMHLHHRSRNFPFLPCIHWISYIIRIVSFKFFGPFVFVEIFWWLGILNFGFSLLCFFFFAVVFIVFHRALVRIIHAFSIIQILFSVVSLFKL